MTAEDLNTQELLQLEPSGGVIRFAGQRTLLIDAVALGLLRRYLITSFGFSAARTVLTQFGFAHGWRMANAIRDQFSWTTPLEWRLAGPKLNSLQGLFRLVSPDQDVRSQDGATFVDSYEAEQHLLHVGRAEHPVCWTTTGLVSGYLSRIEDVETFVLEDRCVARGDAACRFLAKTRSEWGDARTDELRFFESQRLSESLDTSLRHISETLKEAEAALARRRAFVDEPDTDCSGIVSKSPTMRAALGIARRVAKVDSTVLISGESGVGKERIARLVHAESARAAGPFVAVNCGAITDTLLESELFGHVRGAFTGASQDRLGLFEAANRGTLLLDELGDVSVEMQVKLLRVLQEREVRRVGESKSRPVDVRVLGATNHDLLERVEKGQFRRDLYYRLKVVEIHVPPLRDRRSDVLVLARLLLAEAAERLNRTMHGLSPASADQLLRYDWPGNVRELENAMERAVALARGTRVELEDLPEEVRIATPTVQLSAGVRSLADVEKDHILAALELNEGNQTRTAAQLGIGTATLYRRLKSYGLVVPRSKPPPPPAES